VSKSEQQTPSSQAAEESNKATVGAVYDRALFLESTKYARS